MKQTKESFLSLINYTFSKETLKSFFNKLFNNIQINNQIDLVSFNNISGLPYVISEKLFKAFSQPNSSILTQRDFTQGMIKLYSDSFYIRLKLIYLIINNSQGNSLQKDKLKFFLLHFHLQTNITNIQALYDQVDLLYKDKLSFSFEEIIEIAQKRSSDIILLVLFYFYKYIPINDLSIEFYENMTQLDNEDHIASNFNESPVERKTSHMALNSKQTFSLFQQAFHTCLKSKSINEKDIRKERVNKQAEVNSIEFIDPSMFLYEYLGNNYKKDFKSYLNEDCREEDDTDEDLADIISFEQDFKGMKKQMSQMGKWVESECDHNESIKDTNPNKCNSDCAIRPSKLSKEIIGIKDLESNITSLPSQQRQSNPLNKQFDVTKIIPSKEKKSISTLLLFEMSSNNSALFSYECQIKELSKEKYNGRITIIGNILFIEKQKINNTSIDFSLSRMIILKKAFVTSNNTSNNSINLISTIKGIIETYTFTFPKKTDTNEFIDIIHFKTNYRTFETLYECYDILGYGNNGVVKLIKNKNNNKCYAVKIIPNIYEDRDEIKLNNEELDICKLLIQLNDPNILHFHDYYETVEFIYIIMEHINGSTLNQFMKNQPRLYQLNKTSFATQLINNLHFFNSYGIIHRDIKPENIMIVFQDNNYQAKLIDFGFAKVLCPYETLNDPRGTALYASPEILQNKDYSFNTDVWSLGIVLYLLYQGDFPFDLNRTPEEVIKQIINEDSDFNPTTRLCKFDNNNIELIVRKCLERNRNNRATIGIIYQLWKDTILIS